MEEYFVDKATLIIETEISGQLEKFRELPLLTNMLFVVFVKRELELYVSLNFSWLVA